MKLWLVTAPWCTTCKPLKEYITNHGFENIIIKDLEKDFDELKGLNVRSVPVLVFLSNDGTVLNYLPCGGMSPSQMLDAIEEKTKHGF